MIEHVFATLDQVEIGPALASRALPSVARARSEPLGPPVAGPPVAGPTSGGLTSGVGRGDAAVLARAAALAKPVTLAGEQRLAVLAALHGLLPSGLRRGTVGVLGGPAATSLALATVAAATQAGSWLGVLGVPALGLAAAAELGVALERLVAVAAPPVSDWASVAATLVDAFDLVLVDPPAGLPAHQVRRLQARARERGAVVLSLASHPGWSADLVLTTTGACWHGLLDGAGHLQARQVQVEVAGRGEAARLRRATLWLPGPDGAVSSVVADAPGRELRHVG